MTAPPVEVYRAARGSGSPVREVGFK